MCSPHCRFYKPFLSLSEELQGDSTPWVIPFCFFIDFLSDVFSGKSLKNDDVRHHSGGDASILKPRVYFLRVGADQIRPRHAPAMEGNGPTPVALLSGQLCRSISKNQNQRRLFSHELRHYNSLHSLPQLALAPNLPHRLRRHNGRLALPLLPPRRTCRDPRAIDRRSLGDGCSGSGHHRSAVFDGCDG